MEAERLVQAKDYLARAWYKIGECERLKDQGAYPDAVHEAQECIELSFKAIALCLLEEEPPLRHDIIRKEHRDYLQRLWERVPPGRGGRPFINLPRLVTLNDLWAEVYTKSKYGLEWFGVGAGSLFQEGEARLALSHAEECAKALVRVIAWKDHRTEP